MYWVLIGSQPFSSFAVSMHILKTLLNVKPKTFDQTIAVSHLTCCHVFLLSVPQVRSSSAATLVSVTAFSGWALLMITLKGVRCLKKIPQKTRMFSVCAGFLISLNYFCRDEWRRLKRQILAIDACHFNHPMDQYNMEKVKRELNKVKSLC